jgi:metacaspase-1
MDMHEHFHIVPKGSTGTRRAVMIGINYKGEGKLSGCHHDVKNASIGAVCIACCLFFANLKTTLSHFQYSTLHHLRLCLLPQMKEYLMDVHGFQEENINLLIDDKAYTRPTRMNITKAFKKLVQDSEPGDTCFVHFSGHGGKIKDYDNDEGKPVRGVCIKCVCERT